MGSDETDDGNEAEMLGEDGLVEMLAEKNIGRMHALGVKNVITFSPHAYNALKSIYPRFGAQFNVLHYTQLLPSLIKSGKIRPSALPNAAITFHDPCFLGRWNSEYKAPRKALQEIPGAQLVEMDRSRKSALCCGGGSAGYCTDLLGGSKESPSRIRVRQAHATGAGILAVACPNCLTMLEDAVKVEGLENEMAVRDVSELLHGTGETVRQQKG
jgi:Fe-S oxidoreductase